jgi:gliding motility-associated-like protein
MKHPSLLIFFILISLTLQSQVVADFILPDTICVGKTVNIKNLTTGGSRFYWSFCSGNTSVDPIGSVLGGTSGFLGGPAYITLAQDGDSCYSFVTNHVNQSVTVINHGISYSNDALSIKNIPIPGMKMDSSQGIQVKYDNGTWFGFLVCDFLLIRMDFGNSLSNTPSIFVLNTITGMWSLHGLQIWHENNQRWVGITTSSWGNSVWNIDFGNSLANTGPVFTDITRGFSFSQPGPLSIVSENNNYYCFIVNALNSTLCRGDFGSSLMNKPGWKDLGVVCNSDARGIMLIRDCQQTNGFMTRYLPSGKLLYRLQMPQGITGPVSTVSIGNIGNLDLPQQFSEITRVKDTVYTFICSQATTMITRLSFITCKNSSVPSSALYDPPPYSYDSAGIYNVRLIVNEGQPDQQNVCKHIVVVDKPPVHLGPDRILCPGISAFLDAGANCDTVLWSTGDTTRRIKVTQPGTYWVNVSKFGCWGGDTVTVGLYPLIPTKLKPDTTLCQGQKYLLNPGKNYKSLLWNNGDTTSTMLINTGGTYWVHTVDTNNCPGADTVTITMKPAINVNLVHDTAVCTKNAVILNASVPGATYLWQDGSTESFYSVTDPGVYWVRVSRDGCAVVDTSLVHDCNNDIYFPNAFSPNGDGLNDYFRPIGPALSKFTLTVFDRWGQQIFTTNDSERGWDGTYKGVICPAGNYSFIATYELAFSPGVSGKKGGTVILVR